MKSPFPGMDPYLEQPAYWPGFHLWFIGAWCEVIADQLPPSYDALIGERVKLTQLDEETARLLYPDIAVIDRPRVSRSTDQGGGVATLEPDVVPQVIVDEVKEAYIQITRRSDRKLVAVLELLSPANKVGKGFAEYTQKRRDLLEQDVHQFELDLLHIGEPPALLRPIRPNDYRAFLTRAESRGVCRVYTWSMRERLPVLPVPLRKPDDDIFVDLQKAFDVTYERGRYSRMVNYDESPALPISEADSAWIAEQVRNRPGARE